AIDAFDHIDVVSGRSPRAIIAARSGFDGYGLSRADGFAQLACDAAFLAVGVAPQRVLAAKARRERSLFERIIQGGFALEEIAHPKQESQHELAKEQRTSGLIEPHDLILRGIATAIAICSPRERGGN